MANESGGPVAAEIIADLAAASRILAAQGVVDGFGHVSLRHPAAPDRYLMARSLAPALVTPGDIIEYDLDSNPLQRERRAASFLERFIHGEIYKARPDIHADRAQPFAVGDPVRAGRRADAGDVPQRGVHRRGRAGVRHPRKVRRHRHAGRQRARRAWRWPKSWAAKDIVLMRAHGSVACGPTLQTAVFRAVYTEVNARIQHWTHGAGRRRADRRARSRGRPAGGRVNQTAGMRAWDLWRSQVRAQVNW